MQCKYTLFVYEQGAYDICKVSRQLMWPRRLPVHIWGLKHDLIIFVNGFCLVIFRLFHWSLVMLYNVHELDGFRFGGFEGENKFCNLETLMLWFWWTIVVFFFHNGVLYIILVMHACVYELWRIWMLWETQYEKFILGFQACVTSSVTSNCVIY